MNTTSRPAAPMLFHDPEHDDHTADDSYASLPAQPNPPGSSPDTCGRPIKSTHISMIIVISTALLLMSSLIVLFMFNVQQISPHEEVANNNILSASSSPEAAAAALQHGAPASERSYRHFSDAEMEVYLRGRDNVSWQRTAYHFHPAKNFMFDPNGPLYYKGWYHIFYQHNPYAAVWGNMSWGHAVSKDMIDWFHLPLAMVPEHWYEIEGVLSGSATVLPDGQVIMLYTGNSYDFTQVQCLAYAANASDPLLREWVKYSGNPILFPPPGIGYADFRDPSTAWVGPDGKWLVAIGSKHNETGVILLYKTTNFTTYEMLDWELHGVVDTGMWECADLFPISTVGTNGLDMSANGPGIKHVLKESGALFDIDREDYYSIGTYDPIKITWTPDDPKRDVGLGWRYDYGKFYASKSFYDQNKMRRILWAFIGETDSRDADLFKGWASNIPRTVVFDKKTGTNLLQWPIEDLNKLRSSSSHNFEEVEILPGSLIPLDIGPATQLDISATFEVDEEVLEATAEADASFNCTGSDGSAARGVLGPFGLVVIADDSLSELTPIYFYIAKGADGSATTHFCADETTFQSSLNSDVRKMVVGSKVPVLNGEKLTMRLLIDHSVVESFAQGGRIAITSRVYPTKAIYEAAHLFLFNNVTGISIKASLKIWHMAPAKIDPFPFPE